LLEKIGKISMELQAVKENYAKANNELSALTDRLEQAKKERDTLKTENKKFLSQQFSLQAEQVKTAQAVQAATKLENENIDMKATVAQLKATQTAPAAGGIRSTNKDIILLEENVQELKTQNATLQATLEEWMALAKVCTCQVLRRQTNANETQRSYTEYKDMLPMYKQAEQLRTDVDQKDHEIKTLKVQLSAVKTSQSNGVGAGGDATYWKKKYDGLLASVGN
jgi:chromosome segregation ATPase